jgi:V/A-type H+-transporting ATPase subunit A
LIQNLFEAQFEFEAHDAARSFFLNLQNDIKNINFLPFHSERYLNELKAVEDKINAKKKG